MNICSWLGYGVCVGHDADLLGANTTCIPTPNTIIGPYGILVLQIRSNITEDLTGAALHLET
jgi:hypothetical protein